MSADYTINNIYQGGYSSLDPNKSYASDFTGYRVNFGKIGITTNPGTANQIKEVSDKLSSGLKEIDLTLIQPKFVELVSKQQLEDIRRLSELTGIDVSVHGPVTGVNTTGMGQQGFEEIDRKHAEDIIINTLEKSSYVKKDGNVNVTFHTTEGISGSEWKVIGDDKTRRFKKMMVVDRDTGQMVNALQEEVHYSPDMREGLRPEVKAKLERGEISPFEIKRSDYKEVKLEEGKILTPEKRLQSLNHQRWDDSINQLLINKERADEILTNNYPQIQHLIKEIQSGKITGSDLTPTQRQVYDHLRNAQFILEDTQQHVESLFSKAYKLGNEDERRHLKQLSESFKNQLDSDKSPVGQSRAVQELIYGLKQIQPKMFVPLEDFAVEKTSQTFGNAAFAAYKKFKDKAPIISIENPPVGHALSTGEDLKNVIEGSQKVFIKNLMEKEKKSEAEAKAIAKKLIGATWDVGHINILRKQGLTKEDIIKESEKIKPYLKHVHLSDNFGLEHTELPMGMGNVPFKEIMERLGKEGFEAKKIIEAGDWWQQQMNPIQASLEGLGAPMYANSSTPYWNQAPGFFQGYNSGLEGNWLPGINYQTFGTYFSQLPTELGGSTQGGGSRMSGRPME